ncbi:MAG: FAD-dependent oxidoreductase, partial [Thermodesulfobacteriota bacterium]|nr:FAD-dependent oxidoreductase [Thermodesulfobacteriota bacterium]
MTKKIAILGAGPGGYVAAVRAAQLGADVTVIENDQVGGTCLNWGCVPSKILKTTADRLDISRKFGEFGIVTEGEIRLDMETLTERKERVIQTQRKAIETLLRHNRVRHERGKGRILGYGTIEINRLTGEREILSWDRLLIATGSRTAEISAFPFDGERVISSNEALFLNEIPESIVIVGGGVIGCEFAFIFAGLGSRVTVVEGMGRLLPLPSVEEENSKVLQREMKKRKIDFFVNRTVKGIEYGQSGLYVSVGPSPFSGKIKGKESLALETEKLLVCIGRKPNTDGIGIDTLGIKTEQQGWIQVSNKMSTNIENVYAIGD